MSKTATDVIKGLRKGKIDRTAFLTTVYSEIREEVKSSEFSIKSTAIRKLFILALEGYDMEWAAFHILEVMSSPKFSEKHSGLLAASQCFKPNSDILFLATHFFRRELVASNPIDTCVALNCLSCVVNADMSKELLNDCVSLLNASKPILRKKLCVLFYKLFVQYPEGIVGNFERLAEKLKDDNPGVVMGTVNTIYELARINPKFVLFTAQGLYDLLNTTTSNWVIIKLIKLFVELAKIEPRLIKKLLGPFARILSSNPAKSVEFEVIRSVYTIFKDNEEMIKLALGKLNIFLDSHDPNLKYLGLVALQNMLQLMPELSEEYRIFILEALQSKDTTIRLRALSLLKIITNASTLQETIKNLLIELEKPTNSSIKEEVISCCLHLLSFNQYEFVEDFKWMFEVLLKLVSIKTALHEAQLSSIIIDSVLRVEELREEACYISIEILEKFDSLKSEKCEALTALLFIVGEFCSHLDDKGIWNAVELLTKARWRLIGFDENVHNALSSALFKIMSRAKELKSVETCEKYLKSNSMQIEHMEAQERSLMYLNISANCEEGAIRQILKPFLPIHPSAQSFIFAPEQLSLEFQVNSDEMFSVKEDGTVEYHYYKDEDFGDVPMSENEKKMAKLRLQEKQMMDPFYIKPKKGKKKKGKKGKIAKSEKLEEKSEDPVVEKKPEVPKKYSVNRSQPLLPP